MSWGSCYGTRASHFPLSYRAKKLLRSQNPKKKLQLKHCSLLQPLLRLLPLPLRLTGAGPEMDWFDWRSCLLGRLVLGLSADRLAGAKQQSHTVRLDASSAVFPARGRLPVVPFRALSRSPALLPPFFPFTRGHAIGSKMFSPREYHSRYRFHMDASSLRIFCKKKYSSFFALIPRSD